MLCECLEPAPVADGSAGVVAWEGCQRLRWLVPLVVLVLVLAAQPRRYETHPVLGWAQTIGN